MAKATKGPKLSARGQQHVAKVMRMFEAGQLKSGAGNIVKDQKQALAIAYSEARAGAKRGYVKRASATEKGRIRVRPKLTARGKARAKHKTK